MEALTHFLFKGSGNLLREENWRAEQTDTVVIFSFLLGFSPGSGRLIRGSGADSVGVNWLHGHRRAGDEESAGHGG